MRYLTLNNAGDSENNPIVATTTTFKTVTGYVNFRATLNKQNSSETLKSCWIYANNKIFKSLTSQCVETDYSIHVDIDNGVDTYVAVDRQPHLNILYISTTNGVAKYAFYAILFPAAIITLDGYNADTLNKPLVYPVYNS